MDKAEEILEKYLRPYDDFSDLDDDFSDDDLNLGLDHDVDDDAGDVVLSEMSAGAAVDLLNSLSEHDLVTVLKRNM
jgi:hypothetical protein